MIQKIIIVLLVTLLSRVSSKSVMTPWDEQICLNTPRAASYLSLKLAALKLCYDINSDGRLDDIELSYRIKGITCDYACPSNSTASLAPLPSAPAPSTPAPSPPSRNSTLPPVPSTCFEKNFTNSSLISTCEDINRLKGFFNGSNFNLTLLYSSNGTKCDINQFRQNVYPYKNVIALGKSFYG